MKTQNVNTVNKEKVSQGFRTFPSNLIPFVYLPVIYIVASELAASRAEVSYDIKVNRKFNYEVLLH